MKPKKASKQLPPMELAIMQVLWKRGPSSVQAVRAQLTGDPAYTTVQTILNTMEKKGRTKRTLEGRAYIYRASLSREMATGSAIKDFVERMFGGSVEGLLMSLVKTDQVDAATLKRLERAIAKRGDEG
ncbi:MAG TPA: BlaI/MecI/CopY family transcriptional regulator [Edaphobacter sp.]|nr:BlaI/MecI/CopY family transcriptional regulator [Edaphobacter sp.]